MRYIRTKLEITIQQATISNNLLISVLSSNLQPILYVFIRINLTLVYSLSHNNCISTLSLSSPEALMVACTAHLVRNVIYGYSARLEEIIYQYNPGTIFSLPLGRLVCNVRLYFRAMISLGSVSSVEVPEFGPSRDLMPASYNQITHSLSYILLVRLQWRYTHRAISCISGIGFLLLPIIIARII